MKTITILCLVSLLVLSGCINRPASRPGSGNSASGGRTATQNTAASGSVASGGRTTTQNVSPAVGTRASVEVLLSGANGNRVEGSTEFIADQSGLVRLWRQLTGNASAPRVDFDTERVVAIFMGQRNTGGFGYRPGEASYTANGAIQVQILEIRPKPTDRVTQALTSPFIVLKLPKGTGQPSLLFLTP